MICPGRGEDGSGFAGMLGRIGVPGMGVGAVVAAGAGGAGAAEGGGGACGAAAGPAGGCTGAGLPPLPASGGRSGCAAGRVIIRSSVVSAACDAAPAGWPISTGSVAGLVPSVGGAAAAGAGLAASTAGSVSGAAGLASASSAGASVSAGSTKTPKCRRILMATSSSIELECVFFSVTPNSGRIAIIALFGCSHSRASSLIRIFFISTFS
jgi:hypothetical protein